MITDAPKIPAAPRPMRAITYPTGALVRIADICRHPKTGRPGLLPIDRSTWHRWVKEKRVPEGLSLAGSATKVWPIEVVLGLAQPAASAR